MAYCFDFSRSRQGVRLSGLGNLTDSKSAFAPEYLSGEHALNLVEDTGKSGGLPFQLQSSQVGWSSQLKSPSPWISPSQW